MSFSFHFELWEAYEKIEEKGLERIIRLKMEMVGGGDSINTNTDLWLMLTDQESGKVGWVIYTGSELPDPTDIYRGEGVNKTFGI